MPLGPGSGRSTDTMDSIDALSELGVHLANARAALHLTPFGEEKPLDQNGHSLLRAIEVAEAAVARFAEFVEDPFLITGAGATIALTRSATHVVVAVDGTATRADLNVFIAQLKKADQRLLDSAELLGVLLGLAVRWVSAAFAPVVVLQSLTEAAPRILELGRDLGP